MQVRWSTAWKAGVVALACACAFYVTIIRKGGGFGVSTSRVSHAQSRPATGTPDPNFDLTQMSVLRYVLLEINNNYVDPSRVHPRVMLLKGLDAIQQKVAQVLVRYDGDD